MEQKQIKVHIFTFHEHLQKHNKEAEMSTARLSFCALVKPQSLHYKLQFTSWNSYLWSKQLIKIWKYLELSDVVVLSLLCRETDVSVDVSSRLVTFRWMAAMFTRAQSN